MCGISGMLHLDGDGRASENVLSGMSAVQGHRGPDDGGVFVDGGAGLSSRRLSILDLSKRGRMPMSTSDGRYTIVYNGEVYNYRELRRQMEQDGVAFHSGTDTEVVLNLYAREGPSMLNRCNGMFAFAIWDSQERELFLCRDRTGVKPLVYAVHQRVLYFASEEKALLAAGVPAEFDTSTWMEMVMFRYVSGERTPYAGIKRLLPGHYMTVSNSTLHVRQWWSPRPAERSDRTNGSLPVTEFKELFRDSVKHRLISDVPVGALLSGGLDSGAMAAMMAKESPGNIAGFTVRFREQKYDESARARELAAKCGLEYNEYIVEDEEIPGLIEDATRLLDHPIVHENSIHLLAISRFAKPKVTVLLSGEGSDEVLGGYVRYRAFLHAWAPRLMSFLPSRLPRPLDPSGRLGKSLKLLRLSSPLERVVHSSAEMFASEADLEKHAGSLEYREKVAVEAIASYPDSVRQVMQYDQSTYLQSVLDRNDRMTMGASIECREPFLDFRLLEMVAALPQSALFEGMTGKRILRLAMQDEIPQSVLHAPKWGFGTPIGDYLRRIPSLRVYLREMHTSEFVKMNNLDAIFVQRNVGEFMGGQDGNVPLVKQLLFASVWYDVCILGRREIFK